MKVSRLAVATAAFSWVVATAAGAYGQLPDWTDDPIVPRATVVRAVHFQELRREIDLLRARQGLSAYPWTGGILSGAPVKTGHLTELRQALSEAYVAAGRSRPSFTDPARRGMAVRAVHVNELRQRIVDLAFQITLIDVRFDRVEPDGFGARYWVRVTARNTGTRPFGESSSASPHGDSPSLWVDFRDADGRSLAGVRQGILCCEPWAVGEERTGIGWAYISTDRRSEVTHYRISTDPDRVSCIGCERRYTDVPPADVGLRGR